MAMNCHFRHRSLRLSESAGLGFLKSPEVVAPMKLLKFRLGCIAWLLAVTSLCSSCNRLTPTQRAQTHLAAAREEAQHGKTAAAIIDYRRALQDDSKLAVAHYELGKLYLGTGDYLNGARQLTAAVDRDGTNFEARLALADVLLLGKDYEGAKVQADAVLAERHGDPAALLTLAKSLAGLGEQADSQAAVEQVLKAQPTNAAAWLLVAGLQYEKKDFAASERSFRRAIQYDPSQVAAVAAFTIQLLQQNRAPEAENVIRECASKNPNSISAQYILATFLWQQKRLPEAESVFRTISAIGQADPQQRAALAHFYVATNKLDLAEKEYTQIEAKYPDDFVNRTALASLYLATDRYPEAEKLIDSILTAQRDNSEALVLRGQLRIQQLRFDEAIADLQHATRAQPRLVSAHYHLATAQLGKGDMKAAEAELRSALELQADFTPARTLLAGVELDMGELKESLADLDRVVAAKPAVVNPYIMRSMVLAEHGDAPRAEKDLLPLLDEFRDPAARASTYRALAWVMVNQKKYEEARVFLQHASEAQANSRETLYLLGLTYIAEKKTDAAFSMLQARPKQNPRWAEGYEVAGDLMAVAGRYAQSETFFRQAVAINPQLAAAWQGLGDVLARQSNYDAALDSFGKVIQQTPKSGLTYFRIGQVYDKRGDWSSAETAYQKLLELEPDNAAGKNNLAWDYTEHGGNIDVALRLSQEAVLAKPDDPELSDTLGWIYLRKNAPMDAIQVLKQSVSKAPKSPEYNYHLGMAYLRAGRPAEAKQFLEATLTLEPGFAHAEDTRKMLASLKN